ncbi:MAG: glycosyltransferase family 4 protein [Phycisphaeraceae bacterium]|nr:glycosyltransferase family 4 protein [Phycisphaeraceae bacterium]
MAISTVTSATAKMHVPAAASAAKALNPVLISLPHGLDLGGVTTWAVRLANGLAERGREVAMLVHPRGEGQPAAVVELHRKVRRIEPSGWPSMHHIEGDLSPFLPAYRDAVRQMSDETGAPVVLMPNILGDSYGLAAALSLTDFDRVRVLGWQHTDSDYDTGLLLRFEPIISKYVAIDERAICVLGAKLPHRRGDITTVRHGVRVPYLPPERREPIEGRPVRVVYTGRIEHFQKRVLSFAYLSDELTRRGVDHEIVVVGDGPAAAEFDAMIASRPKVVRKGLAGTKEVEGWLKWGDAFVLGSRFEGLCISRIEAMAHGCVPLVTNVNSGAATGIEPGVSGLIVDAQPGDDEKAVGVALADAVRRFIGSDRNAMAIAAWNAALSQFSIDEHVEGVSKVLDEIGRSPARPWRASWPCAFSFSPNSPGCSGTVPSHGPRRMKEVLELLAGRKVAIHGAGRHTIELAGVLSESAATIVAITDDNRDRWGKPFLGWQVWEPARLAATGATDVVISSWLHSETIWGRRGVYESQGLRVHRLYE